MNANTIFSKNLVKYRKIKGFSQRTLAQLTGLSQRIITSLENQPEYLPLNKLETLANALEVSIPQLFVEKNNISDKELNLINNIDVRWLKKIEDIKKLSEMDQKEISRHINYLIEKNDEKKTKIKELQDSK